MKSSKIPFISRSQSQFQNKFFSEYIRYGILWCILLFFLLQWILNNGFNFVKWFIFAGWDYAIGQSVELEWQMKSVRSNGYIEFLDNNQRHRFLKSSDLNLSAFSWKSVIVWTINESSIEWNYIIDVSTVYQVLTNSWSKLNTKYMNIDKWISITLQDPNFFVDIDNYDNIIIKDLRTFRPALKIQSFACDRKFEDKNCGQLIREAENKKKFDNFISANSLKYYKINDTTRFTDDKYGKWYHVTVSNDAVLYQLSEYISIINKDRINWKIYDKLSTLCINNEFTMTQAENIELKKANNNRFAIIQGKSSKEEKIQCEVYLDDTSKQWVNFELVNILPL